MRHRHLGTKQFRQALRITGVTVLFVSFQNCAPPPENTLCPVGETCTSDASSSNGQGAGSGSRLPAGGAGGASGGGSGGGFGPAGGSSGGGSGGGSSGGGWDTGGGGGWTPGGGGGWTDPDPTPGGGVTPAFSFYTDLPTNKAVAEGSTFVLETMVIGGTPPYTFRWYHNNNALESMAATIQNYADIADRFSKEGNYHLVVTDSAQRTLRSKTVNVSFQIPQVGCAQGVYTAQAGNPLSGYGVRPLSDLYQVGNRKWLIPTTHPDIAFFDGNWAYYGFARFQVDKANFHDKLNIGCQHDIPRINTPPYNWNCQYNHRDDGCTPQVHTGRVEFICENNKWRLVKNTCQWSYPTPPPDTGGGGGP